MLNGIEQKSQTLLPVSQSSQSEKKTFNYLIHRFVSKLAWQSFTEFCLNIFKSYQAFIDRGVEKVFQLKDWIFSKLKKTDPLAIDSENKGSRNTTKLRDISIFSPKKTEEKNQNLAGSPSRIDQTPIIILENNSPKPQPSLVDVPQSPGFFSIFSPKKTPKTPQQSPIRRSPRPIKIDSLDEPQLLPQSIEPSKTSSNFFSFLTPQRKPKTSQTQTIHSVPQPKIKPIVGSPKQDTVQSPALWSGVLSPKKPQPTPKRSPKGLNNFISPSAAKVNSLPKPHPLSQSVKLSPRSWSPFSPEQSPQTPSCFAASSPEEILTETPENSGNIGNKTPNFLLDLMSSRRKAMQAGEEQRVDSPLCATSITFEEKTEEKIEVKPCTPHTPVKRQFNALLASIGLGNKGSLKKFTPLPTKPEMTPPNKVKVAGWGFNLLHARSPLASSPTEVKSPTASDDSEW